MYLRYVYTCVCIDTLRLVKSSNENIAIERTFDSWTNGVVNLIGLSLAVGWILWTVCQIVQLLDPKWDLRQTAYLTENIFKFKTLNHHKLFEYLPARSDPVESQRLIQEELQDMARSLVDENCKIESLLIEIFKARLIFNLLIPDEFQEIWGPLILAQYKLDKVRRKFQKNNFQEVVGSIDNFFVNADPYLNLHEFGKSYINRTITQAEVSFKNEIDKKLNRQKNTNSEPKNSQVGSSRKRTSALSSSFELSSLNRYLS